ncbi:MAG: mucoidy inhibitor MuiA family protein [Leptospiraceae bacterium]|nr:mucoidy inhibitor MuiA family protein [Leptospiraceae bacterium]
MNSYSSDLKYGRRGGLLALFFVVSGLGAQTLPFPIENVVLYNDRAVVRRAAEIPLQAGLNRIIYRGPAVKLKSDSLSGFCANSSCIVQSVWTRTDKSDESVDTRLAALEKERKDLQTSLDAMNRQKEKLETLANLNDRFLGLLLQGVSDSAFEAAIAANKWQNARREIARSSDDIQLDIQELLRKRDDLKEKLDLVESRIQQLASDLSDEIRLVELTLYVPEAMKVKAGFDYMVEDARWDVSYNLDYREGARKIPGKVVGLIQQSSGEDWVNVKLELSTSRPDRGGKRPALSALQVYAREVQTTTDIVTQNQAVDMDGMMDGESEQERSDAGEKRQIRFKIPDRVSIPSGRRYQRITVASLDLEILDQHLRVVGQASSSAHRALQLKNRSTYSMLPGKAYIYGADGYMGMTYIDYTPPGAELLAGLGVSGDVRLKRRIYRRQKDAGLISSNRIYLTEISLQLENPSSREQKVRLFERTPTSSTEKVKVRILDGTTPGHKELSPGSGILVWDFQMKAGEKKEIKLSYEVEVPEGVSGNFYGN